jgi:AraC-like DNA-binding protein
MNEVIQSLVAGATLFLSFLIFVNPNNTNRSANRWLAAFFFCLFIIFFDNVLEDRKIYQRFPHLLSVPALAFFAIPPVFYFSIVNFVTQNRAFRKKDILHFSFLILFFILQTPFIFSSGEQKLKVYQDQTMSISDHVILGLIIAQLSVYCFLCHKRLSRHQQNIKLVLSEVSQANLQWLKNLLYAFLAMSSLYFFTVYVNSPFLERYSIVVYFLLIFTFGYYALKQGEVYSFSAKETIEVQELFDENVSEKKKLLPDENLPELKAKLARVMDVDKLYLDNDLSLPKMATAVGISTHALSYALNHGFNQNFFQFVNQYRIEEAKRLLLSPEQNKLNMVGIAFQSGFNSKTAFNTTFKKMTGLSPTEFRMREKELKTI